MQKLLVKREKARGDESRTTFLAVFSGTFPDSPQPGSDLH
jgi:hypothetical protein